MSTKPATTTSSSSARPLFDLTGQTALVTGGAGMLGLQHAIALSQLGCQVFLGDLKDAHEAFAPTILMDVNDRESIQKAVGAIVRITGRLDILVNNAALNPPLPNPGDTEDWALALSTGLVGAWRCAEVAKPYLKVILNIASNLSVYGPDQSLYGKGQKPATYSAVKAGLVGLTRWQAVTYAPKIRANALSPGGVLNGQPMEFVQAYESRVPLGRMASKDEYRGAVQFLCSDASKYLTGVNLVMDGGRHCL